MTDSDGDGESSSIHGESKSTISRRAYAPFLHQGICQMSEVTASVHMHGMHMVRHVRLVHVHWCIIAYDLYVCVCVCIYIICNYIIHIIIISILYNTDKLTISLLGRCVSCYKSKRSTFYCRIKKAHKGSKASPCSTCFEKGISTSNCRLLHRHCGPGVNWCTQAISQDPPWQCLNELVSVTKSITSTEPEDILVDTSHLVEQLGIHLLTLTIILTQLLIFNLIGR